MCWGCDTSYETCSWNSWLVSFYLIIIQRHNVPSVTTIYYWTTTKWLLEELSTVRQGPLQIRVVHPSCEISGDIFEVRHNYNKTSIQWTPDLKFILATTKKILVKNDFLTTNSKKISRKKLFSEKFGKIFFLKKICKNFLEKKFWKSFFQPKFFFNF